MKNLSEKIVNRQRQLVTLMIGKLAPYVLDKGHPADRVLARYFKDHRELGSRDRRFLSECFFSWFRWLGWTKSLGLSLIDAASLSVHLDQTEIHPALTREGWQPLGGKTLDEKLTAVNEWFQGLEKNRPAGSSGFQGLDLSDSERAFGASQKKRPAGERQNVDAVSSPRFQTLEKSDLLFPEFASRLRAQASDAGKSVDFPADSEEKFYETLQQRPPTWLRLRSDAFKEKLTEAGIPFEEHPHLNGAVSIPAGRSLGALGSSGQFEVQDIASQAVGAVAAPEAGSDWWDACAGAGGKALQLADLIGRGGKVFATDVREEALANCKKRARTDGIANIRLQLHDLAKDEPFTKEFDGVLVDAPCSGWGTWSRNPDARWRTDPRDPAQKRNLQLRMLNSAAQCVKPGGLLIYAVCTFTTEETVEVLDGFLKDHPGFAPEPFASPLTGAPTDGSLQIWPWDGPGDGMFIVRLRRENNK